MKIKFFIFIMFFISIYSYSEKIKLNKLIKYDEYKSFRFIGDDFMYYKSTKDCLFYFDAIKIRINSFEYPIKRDYHIIQLINPNRLIIGLTDNKTDTIYLKDCDFYFVDLRTGSYEKNYDKEWILQKNILKKETCIPKKLQYLLDYDPDYISAKIGEYYVIAQDAKNHGISYNEQSPEKHAYHDMDLCLVNESGEVCAVLPFTVDDQTACKLSILESSPDEKLLKIKVSASYAFAKINDDILKEYPELGRGVFYFIFSIENENNNDECGFIDLTEDITVEPGKEIEIENTKKDYSMFDLKINDKHEKKTNVKTQNDEVWWK